MKHGICLILLLILSGSLLAAEYAVVVHPDNQTQVSPEVLLQIFKKETTIWEDGTNVIVYVPKKSKVTDALLKALGSSKKEVDTHFLLLREQASHILPPKRKRFATAQKLVRRNRSAIAVVKKSQAQDFKVLLNFSS